MGKLRGHDDVADPLVRHTYLGDTSSKIGGFEIHFLPAPVTLQRRRYTDQSRSRPINWCSAEIEKIDVHR